MRPRSQRKQNQKNKSNTIWVILAMVLALSLGFFSAPLLIEKVSDIEEGFWSQGFIQDFIEGFNESYFGQGLKSLWQNIPGIEDPDPVDDPNKEVPGITDPTEPDEPEEEQTKLLLDFPSMEVWTLQLALSEDSFWADYYRSTLDSALPIYIVDKEYGAILFFGPYATPLIAEEYYYEAEELGFTDAYPASWYWPQVLLDFESADPQSIVKTKATIAFLKIVSLLWQEERDTKRIGEELQILASTNFPFETQEEEEHWFKRLSLLQQLAIDEGNQVIKQEVLALVFQDRLYHEALEILP